MSRKLMTAIAVALIASFGVASSSFASVQTKTATADWWHHHHHHHHWHHWH